MFRVCSVELRTFLGAVIVLGWMNNVQMDRVEFGFGLIGKVRIPTLILRTNIAVARISWNKKPYYLHLNTPADQCAMCRGIFLTRVALQKIHVL